MAYDEDLADRIRELISMEPGLTEKRMFGGLGFMLDGNLAVAASGQGGILVRVAPDEGERLLASTPAEPMETGGRSMRGWLRVAPDHLKTKRQLSRWVGLGVSYARTLEPKAPKKPGSGARR